VADLLQLPALDDLLAGGLEGPHLGEGAPELDGRHGPPQPLVGEDLVRRDAFPGVDDQHASDKVLGLGRDLIPIRAVEVELACAATTTRNDNKNKYQRRAE